VTQPETTRHVEGAIRGNGGSIDVVVNNAGYSLLGSIEDMSEADIEAQFSTNLFGPIRVLKGALPFMRKQRSGTVVNVSSSAGFEAFPGCAMYAGSKFALEGETLLSQYSASMANLAQACRRVWLGNCNPLESEF
jgi:NAD(P)-dependent dehydrogenase (short-subunit alcohol dehydrogenase family)